MRNALLIVVFTSLTLIVAAQERAPSSPASSSRLGEWLGADLPAGFPRVLEPRPFVFPADHGPHPAYRNEWWYTTGNVDAADGRRYGFELTLFRFALAPQAPDDPSAWRSNQVFVGHLALTDVGRREFHVAERYSRGALALAGARSDPPTVWLEDWSLAGSPTPDGRTGWRLRAAADGFGVDLALTPAKAPVANGHDGVSQKSGDRGNASYYYSVTRLEAQGTISVRGEDLAARGYAWLDREWGSSGLARNQRGWDWFALQLDDGTELMFYQLRRDDGGRDPVSAGTWVARDGSSRALDAGDVDIEVQDHWDSPTGGRYPMRWRLTVAPLGLELTIDPVLRGQELVTDVRYWEGAVDVRGRRGDNPVGGRGYVELTGYAD